MAPTVKVPGIVLRLIGRSTDFLQRRWMKNAGVAVVRSPLYLKNPPMKSTNRLDCHYGFEANCMLSIDTASSVWRRMLANGENINLSIMEKKSGSEEELKKQ